MSCNDVYSVFVVVNVLLFYFSEFVKREKFESSIGINSIHLLI